MDMITDNYNDIKRFDSIFTDFLNLFISYLCGRCSVESIVLLKPGTGKPHIHHSGFINRFLTSTQPLSLEDLDKFIDDTEHGMLHGIMTAFMLYYITTYTDLIQPHLRTMHLQKTFSTCLLHDYLKTVHKDDSVEYKQHDKLLKQYFNIDLEAYSHSDPEIDGSLVLSDRFELQRYSDYKTWADDRLFSQFYALNNNQRTDLRIFYERYRPAIQHIFEHRASTWIRHGLEQKEDNIFKDESFPVENTYLGLNDIINKQKAVELYPSNPFPIESDSFPITRGVEDRGVSDFTCANHGGRNALWNKIKGFMPVETFVNNGGKFIDSNVRDHLYAYSDISESEWTFIFNITTDKVEQYPAPVIMDIVNNNIGNGAVSQETVVLFFGLVKMLSGRLRTLNYRLD